MSVGPAIPSYNARHAMPGEAALDQVGRIDLYGRLAEQGQPELVEALRRDRQQVVALAARLIEPDLRPLLEWILDITLRRPVFLPNLGAQSDAYCALREGQNQVAWLILQAIAEARGEQPPIREGL